MSAKWTPLIYFLVGQAGWFACVISAAKGAAWVGIVFAVALVILHLARVVRPLAEIKLLAAVLIISVIWESALVFFHLLAYPAGATILGLAPCWILAVWAMFAAQLNTTYHWLKTRIYLAALLGAVAGPVSFHAGAALGALRFVKPWPAAFALAIGWAVLLPVIVILSRHWDGVRLEPGLAQASGL